MTIRAFAPSLLLCLTTCLIAQETQDPPTPRSAARTADVTKHAARLTTALDGFSESVERLLADVNPAVVDISTDSFGEPEDASGGKANVLSRQSREGTGVIVSANGDVITNAHVVMSAKRIQIRLRDPSASAQRAGGQPRTVPAEVVGIDKESDLALLKIAGTNWKSLRFTDSAHLRQGQVVFAVGSPMGLDNSVSMGIISAVERQLDTDSNQAYIQTDAPINPGNSGGPLINTHGEIVGINTFIFTSSGGNEGLGFAIPSNLVRDVYAQLKRYGRVRRGELGVVVRTVTPTLAKALNLPRDRGVLIQDVTPGKAAADAGVQVNDVVIRVEGRSVSNLRQFSSNLFRSEIGGKLKLEVLRGETRAESDTPRGAGGLMSWAASKAVGHSSRRRAKARLC